MSLVRTAARRWTEGNTWFSTEISKKGRSAAGSLADLGVLTDDYFAIAEDAIQDIRSVLTIVDREPVRGRARSKTGSANVATSDRLGLRRALGCSCRSQAQSA